MSRKYKIQKDLFRTQSYLYKKLALFKVSYTSAFQLISEIQTHARPGQSMLAKSHSWFKDLTPPSINHLARNCTGSMGQARIKGFWGQGTDAHCPTQLDRLRTQLLLGQLHTQLLLDQLRTQHFCLPWKAFVSFDGRVWRRRGVS